MVYYSVMVVRACLPIKGNYEHLIHDTNANCKIDDCLEFIFKYQVSNINRTIFYHCDVSPNYNIRANDSQGVYSPDKCLPGIL